MDAYSGMALFDNFQNVSATYSAFRSRAADVSERAQRRELQLLISGRPFVAWHGWRSIVEAGLMENHAVLRIPGHGGGAQAVIRR
ncbi:hypothetical protein AB7M22_002516 [Pseudomonas sp. ADAK2 TE3594]